MERVASNVSLVIAALVGGALFLLIALSVLSEMSPLYEKVMASDFGDAVYTFLILATLPAIVMDISTFGNPHQFFHWAYFAGVFLEGAAIGCFFVILCRAVRARKTGKSGEAA